MTREVAFYRYIRAFWILVVMPMAFVKTAIDPSAYHLILLAYSAAYTAAVGKLYHRAIQRGARNDRQRRAAGAD